MQEFFDNEKNPGFYPVIHTEATNGDLKSVKPIQLEVNRLNAFACKRFSTVSIHQIDWKPTYFTHRRVLRSVFEIPTLNFGNEADTPTEITENIPILN